MMNKVRQDAWSHEDDLLLAETVLRHIREGGTKLNAFEEVGDRLDRTGAACGFRWNAIVRKKYEQAVSIAKRQIKHMKRAILNNTPKYNFEDAPKEPVSFSLVETNKTHSEAAKEPSFSAAESSPSAPAESMNLTRVIDYLKLLNTENLNQSRLTAENKKLQQEIKMLREENALLLKEKEALYTKQQTVEEDYQSLIQIMDRARKMVLFQENDSITPASAPSFKMDKNGNLEKMAK
jgi:prespore-specific regulator